MTKKIQTKKIHTKNQMHRSISKIMRTEERKAWLFLLPSLLGLFVFILLPFADVFRRSFCAAMSSDFVGLDNFKTVWKNIAFRLAIKNTLKFIGICLPLLLLFSLLLAMLLYHQKKQEKFFKMSFLLPMAIPVASIVVLWKLFFHANGLLNGLFTQFGIKEIDFLNSSKAFYVLVFSYLWKNSGYDMILWLTGLNGISVSLYEAASVDGAGGWNKFRYITLPQLMPTVFMIGVLSFINSFKVFREAYLIAGSYPDNSIYMLQHVLSNWFIALDIQKMCAAAVMLVIVFLVLILVLIHFDKDEDTCE